MKKILPILLIFGLMLAYSNSKSQVGIGTNTPDSSAVLDLYSDTRGLLLPRFTTLQRNLISGPATGLLIYNVSTGDVQVNTGTPALPVWSGLKVTPANPILSVTASGDISTSSITSVLIPGMAISPPAGTYLIMFNGQYGLLGSVPISTEQAVIDLLAAYNQVMAVAATNTTHAAVFGNGEILPAGVYTMAGAVSLAGFLIMNGGGDTNSVFIIRAGGALTTGALTTVILTNGARARNIFWVAEGAISLAATTIMKGTIISHTGAVSAAAGSVLEGRMFTNNGAIAFGPGTAYIPSGNSYINLGVLSSFVMFTSVGALANTGPSVITGDVGTNVGAIAGFDGINGNVYGPGAAPEPVNNTLVTFSIYQNGVLIANSSRTSDINTSVMELQAMATVLGGESIEIRWKVDAGQVVLGNRIMTLVRSE